MTGPAVRSCGRRGFALVLVIVAVVAAMIATSGDECFVMLAMIPKQSLFLFGLLGMTAFVAGALTDVLVGKFAKRQSMFCGDF